MVYDKILARSFSRREQKKLGCVAFFACFLVALSFCSVLEEFSSPLPILNLSFSIGLRTLLVGETSISHQIVRVKKPNRVVATKTRVQECQIVENSTTTTKTISLCCNLMERHSDYCNMAGDIRVHGSSSTIFMTTSSLLKTNNSFSVRPYARKGDETAMRLVREWSLKPITTDQNKEAPQCTQNHTVPAVLFSTGAYANNHFHGVSDIIIPLFITSRRFDGQVQFLITNKNPKWVSKFEQILKSLSNFELINADDSKQVPCFPSITVGLTHHKELGIDPTKSNHSMSEFQQFLRNTYSLKRSTINNFRNKTPHLMIISRKRTRAFTNVHAIEAMAKELGFEVIVSEAGTKMRKFAEMVNSCDVMMGVHGAGLTNVVFLPEGAVVIQIVPLGNMAWIARNYYEEPLGDMGLGYLEYKIREEESSLIKQYPRDDVVFKDPMKIKKQGWVAFKSIYLKQNVEIDVMRFKDTLVQALELLNQRRY